MKKIFDYLHLKEVGLLEMTFAFTPILMGFSIGEIPLSALMWILLFVLVFLKYGKLQIKIFKPLLYFILYWFIHQTALLLIADVNLNSIIVQIVYFAAVFILSPSMSAERLRGSMNWVAIISIIGLLYQWSELVRGNGVHPLEIPGLTMLENRMEDSLRPSSFYMEPAAYVSFMICPLALALVDKKYIWSIVMVLSIFLTTSSTGIILSFILIGASLLAGKVKTGTIVFVMAMGFGLAYMLTTLEEFEAGVEKLATTEVSTNIRLSQGPAVVRSMRPEEYVFGVPYSSAYNYCKAGRMTDVVYYGESVYMSTFWDMILCFGFVGLLLYIFVYYKLFKANRVIWPMLFCLLATMFSDPDGIKTNYIYKLIFMLVIVYSDLNSCRTIKKIKV